MGAEFFHGLAWLGVGTVVTLLSRRYGLGSLTDPGPGALPFGLGLVFILLSVVLIVESVRNPRAWGARRPFPTGAGWRKVVLVLVTIALAGAFFETLGYLVAVFLLVTVTMLLVEPRRWRLALLTGIVSSLGSYVVFDVWLAVQLPRGILSL